MTTINSQKIVNAIIDADGYYSDDPRVICIWQYHSMWGNKCFKLIYEGANPILEPSPYVINPIIYWRLQS
jgi:hypothetical protein